MKNSKVKLAIGIILMILSGLLTVGFSEKQLQTAIVDVVDVEEEITVRIKPYNIFSVPVDNEHVIWEETFNRNNFIHKATLGYHRLPAGLSSAKFDKLFSFANQFIGIPYFAGGKVPSTGFDCSGFVQYVYNSCGISLSSASCAGQYEECYIVPEGDEKPGDIVFCKGTGTNPDDESMTHVGIYIGDGKMIHSSSMNGIICSRLDDEYWIDHVSCFGRPY